VKASKLTSNLHAYFNIKVMPIAAWLSGRGRIYRICVSDFICDHKVLLLLLLLLISTVVVSLSRSFSIPFYLGDGIEQYEDTMRWSSSVPIFAAAVLELGWGSNAAREQKKAKPARVNETGSVDLKWYPPANTSINNLDTALHGTGVYGFIFNTSHTSDEKYGTYNWCNMPHVRRKEYVRPSAEYTLKYIEVVSSVVGHLSWLTTILTNSQHADPKAP
jgi:hypothetical protein